MQPIVHFLMSIIAGLGVGLHCENKKKKYSIILLLSFVTACIDLDHLSPLYQENGVKILHNIFVFILFPVSLFLGFYIYERGKNISIKQRVSLLLCVMFVGHMFLDCITSRVFLLYPFSTDGFTMGNIGINLDPIFFTLTSYQMLLIFWGVLILCANILETLTYNEIERDEPLEISWKIQRIKDNKMQIARFFTIKRSAKLEEIHRVNVINTHDTGIQSNDDTIAPEDVTEYICNFIDNLPERR